MIIDIPLVKRKSGEQKFDIGKIVESLFVETGLDEIKAKQIAIEVARFIISKNIKIVTAPLIREITNVFLLSNGFERERFLYTRIGFPFADLTKILKDNFNSQSIIQQHILQEYNAVKKLIDGNGKD